MQIDRRGHDAKRVMQHRHVEAPVVEEFHDRGIGQQALKIGSARLAGADLHDIRCPVAARQLHDAEPIAADGEAQRLRVYGRRLANEAPAGKSLR